MNKKKILALALGAVMLLSSSVVAVADTNPNQTYPKDVLGTDLLAPVKSLVDKKIITGDADGLFHAEKNISRAEFATMMAKASNNTSNLKEMEKVDIFNDLQGYTWAKSYINAANKAGLIKGIGDNKFAPANNVTYIEVMTIIIRTRPAAYTEIEGNGTWPNNYINYIQTYNLLGDVVVKDWNAPATKGDVAKLVYRNMPK